MTDKKDIETIETLGEYLVRLRNQKNLDFDDIIKETKIPPKALKSIEADDYGQLPADAFARGFYVLYAKYLGIDPAEVLERFEGERIKGPSKGKFSAPSKKVQTVNTMAARPSMTTASTLGSSLVIIIAAVSLFFWYFSWNPATYLSEKLRSFQDPITTEIQSDGGQAVSSAADNKDNAVDSKYFLTVNFLEDTTVTISIDNRLPEKEVYTKGSTRSWYANTSVSLILPEMARVEILFNGSKIDLPQAQSGLISVNLP